MKREAKDLEPNPANRRRFLRDSLRGSLPLVLGLTSPEASEEESALRETDSPRPAPPPEAESRAPAPTKRQLDQIQEAFTRDNPDLTRYPSD